MTVAVMTVAVMAVAVVAVARQDCYPDVANQD
jgi:hypothetical protein